MKKIITLLLLINFTFTFAQDKTRDVLYLKNGSVIKGSITEMNPSTGIKIKTSDGSLFVYKMDEVLKTEKEVFVGNEVNQKTSSLVSLSAIENVFKNYISSNRPDLKFIGVSRENGIKKEINGQEIYEIEYELVIEPTSDIYINEKPSMYHNKAFLTNFDYYLKQANATDVSFGVTKNLKLVKKGTRLSFQGTLPFEETDNGWRAKEFTNKNFNAVSSNYVTKEMARERKAKQEKNSERLKKEGDWKINDIESFNVDPIYKKVENVTMFENANVEFSINNKCTDCRNDNLTRVGETFFDAVNSSNRYIDLNKEEYTNSKQQGNMNISNISYYVTDIIYDYKVKKDATGKGWEGYTCKIKYGISTNAKLYNPITFDYKDTKIKEISSKDGFLAKKYAFQDALKKLTLDVKKSVYKSEQLSLKVISIELDKKGKPEFLIFEKPNRLFDLNKITFMLIEKSALKIKDNKFKLDSKIGDLTYKKSDFPEVIKCKIRGNKMKKKLKEYLTKEELLIGISKY